MDRLIVKAHGVPLIEALEMASYAMQGRDPDTLLTKLLELRDRLTEKRYIIMVSRNKQSYRVDVSYHPSPPLSEVKE